MKPPSVARLLLRLLPPRDRDAILGDLAEEFTHICRVRGQRTATRWYWRQALASVPPAIRLRFRARYDPADHLRQRVRERLWPQVARDLRFALRSWRREPLFAATVVATQALGVAVGAAVLSAAHEILIRPLPYPAAADLLRVLEGERAGQFSYPDFLELRRSTRNLARVVGFSGGSRSLTGHGGAAEQVASAEVTPGFFEALGVVPAHGRTFAAEESRREAQPVAMVTHGAWRRRFGGDPYLVGGAITLGGRPHAVVGILPPDFEFPLRGQAEIWLPLRTSRAQEERGYWHWLDVIARRAPGVTDEQVAADLAIVAGVLARDDPKWHGAARLHAIPLRDDVVAPVRPALRILLAGAALLVAIAWANVAGLVLARSASRVRELSVRAAIGAGPGRLARQLTAETMLLMLAGSAVGLFAAHALVRSAVAALPPQQRAALLHADRLGVSPEVVLLAAATAVAGGFLLGLRPALRRGQTGLVHALTTRAASGTGARTRTLLVAAEVALALMLIAGTALLARSVYHLSCVSPGFDVRGLLTLRVSLTGARYADAASVRAVRGRLLDAFRSIPGVSGVATIDHLPLTGTGNNGTLQFAGRSAGGEGPTVLVRTVSPEYFEVMGVPLRGGRLFTERDRAGTSPVVLVNERLVEQVRGEAAVGQRVVFEFVPGRPAWEIVGVVGDEQFDELDRGRSPVVYFPYAQDPEGTFSVVIRTAQPEALAPALRRAAATIDAALPLFAVRTMAQIAAQSRAMYFRRAVLSILGVFALAAVVLAAVAVYGTLAYVVAQRTREIGIRVSLGARRRDVICLMLRHGMGPTLAGAAIGLLGSLGLAGFLRSMLFGVGPTDASTLAVSLVFLCAVALAACVLPVLRASRVDPAITLRQE